jgi:hypothetical protein
VVSSPLTAGLLDMLKNDIVPRLLAEAPGQPSDEELKANSLLHRFTLVFDREGYSPEFFLGACPRHAPFEDCLSHLLQVSQTRLAGI